MSHFRNDAYTRETQASRDRLLARMLPVADALPRVVAGRDAKGAEALLARRTKAELHALTVILASWVAEAEGQDPAASAA
jgi:hypothetical protein